MAVKKTLKISGEFASYGGDRLTFDRIKLAVKEYDEANDPILTFEFSKNGIEFFSSYSMLDNDQNIFLDILKNYIDSDPQSGEFMYEEKLYWILPQESKEGNTVGIFIFTHDGKKEFDLLTSSKDLPKLLKGIEEVVSKEVW